MHDLAELVTALDLHDAIHVGQSTRTGRHGTSRVSKVVLISAIPPLMLKTASNPGHSSIDIFDGLRAGVLSDRSQLFRISAFTRHASETQSVKLVSRVELKVYPGASHGICSTLKNAINEDLLAFLARDRVAVA
jgi:pimeloyl-ACP methyl ester carboxylesterase